MRFGSMIANALSEDQKAAILAATLLDHPTLSLVQADARHHQMPPPEQHMLHAECAGRGGGLCKLMNLSHNM